MIDVEAIHLSRMEAVLTDGSVMKVIALFDDEGEKTGEASEARTASAILGDRSYVIDLRGFDWSARTN